MCLLLPLLTFQAFTVIAAVLGAFRDLDMAAPLSGKSVNDGIQAGSSGGSARKTVRKTDRKCSADPACRPIQPVKTQEDDCPAPGEQVIPGIGRR